MNSRRNDPKGPGFPIRKSTDQSLLAAPRGLSQRATSFIASWCQGIHQMPLKRLILMTQSRAGTSPTRDIDRHLIKTRPELPSTRRAAHGNPAPTHDKAVNSPRLNKPIHNAKQHEPPRRCRLDLGRVAAADPSSIQHPGAPARHWMREFKSPQTRRSAPIRRKPRLAHPTARCWIAGR